MLILSSSAGFETTTSGFSVAVTSDTCFTEDTNDSADTKSARHEQFRAKEKTPTTELNFFFSKKNFRRKVKMKCSFQFVDANFAESVYSKHFLCSIFIISISPAIRLCFEVFYYSMKVYI